MYLNLYFGNNRLQISDNFSNSPSFDQEISDIYSKAFVENFTSQKNLSLIYRCQDVDKAFQKLAAQFEKIIACGGLVFNKQQELLMIYRRGVWDLPKGKLDEGEDFETCAMREVMEETGLRTCTIESYALSCFHLYEQNKTWLLKETKWYFMQSTDTQKLTPQLEEQIEKVEWVSRDKALKRLRKSYRSFEGVIDVL